MGRISTRLRFEILKRDGFKCVYCGASGGDVELQIDHQNPRCEGGTDDYENLVTACFTCNIGKGGIPLDKKASQKKPAARPGLVGKCFMIFGKDGSISHQGIIRAAVTDQQYLIQYFDWVMGEPSIMAIVNLSEMIIPALEDKKPGSWIFFEDDEHLRFWSDNYGRKYTSGGRYQMEKESKVSNDYAKSDEF